MSKHFSLFYFVQIGGWHVFIGYDCHDYHLMSNNGGFKYGTIMTLIFTLILKYTHFYSKPEKTKFVNALTDAYWR